MTTWERKPQERNGQKYFFSGRIYFTKGVYDDLHFDVISAIYDDVRTFANERNGIDYLQVYTDKEDRKLFFIDQLDTKMLTSGDYENEQNFCTLLWAHEY